jgi:hypothetical protein
MVFSRPQARYAGSRPNTVIAGAVLRVRYGSHDLPVPRRDGEFVADWMTLILNRVGRTSGRAILVLLWCLGLLDSVG